MSGGLSAYVQTHTDSRDGGGLQLGKDAFGSAEALLRAIDLRCVRVLPLLGDHTRVIACMILSPSPVAFPLPALCFVHTRAHRYSASLPVHMPFSFIPYMYPPACLHQVPQLWREPALSCSREGRPSRHGGVSTCSGFCLHM